MTPLHNGERCVQWASDNSRVVGCGQGITDAGVLTTHARVKPTNARVLITHARVMLCLATDIDTRDRRACADHRRCFAGPRRRAPHWSGLWWLGPLPPPQPLLFLNQCSQCSSSIAASRFRAVPLSRARARSHSPCLGSFWKLAWRRQLGAECQKEAYI